ncbi:Linear gramicidin synthase subunit D [Symbiodinium microadriaticum]|uniref:Linear gramicidin synthase subunit D n=1 Tax=Symbiodinium microadriaticum TaxID=2951 RepID=A0A1Q9ED25_SYMMI|nr:Linear gramicidin synthase subunit D [Symbiodinium microadriaticum]
MWPTGGDYHVDVLMITPSVLDLLLDVHELQKLRMPLRGLKHITTVGEPLPCSVANRTVAMPNLKATLRNFYGASESSCTIYQVPAHGVDLRVFPNKVPAGQPQPHADVYLMAPGERPFRVVAEGEAGEVCFGGVLAKGYHKLPELTEAKFVSTEHGRLYVTGDLGRWKDGVLEVIGRIDRQVKVNGVRVEPEEVEAVLRDFHMATEVEANNCNVAPAKPSYSLLLQDHLGGDLENVAVHDRTVNRAAVVTTSGPAQLVAFIEPRTGCEVKLEEVQAHCRANLAPAYVPKYILLQPALPSLPNGKMDYAALRAMADEHALQTTETVLDSLGQMRSMSKWAVLENAVIHRCYAFWMLGVLLDHYALCAMTLDPNDPTKTNSQPFCTALAGASIAPWSEVLLRSIGNDQDLFGFIMLGAYQDSRPDAPNQPKKKLRLNWMDLYILFIYFFIALPLPQLCSFLTRGQAYPDRTWQSSIGTETSGWDMNYIRGADVTSGHRWYLLMVLQAKLYVVLCDAIRIPSWVQVAFAIWCSYSGPLFWGDTCSKNVSPGLTFGLTWLLDGCWVWIRWVEWYAAFYVFCLHYLRPIVQWMSKVVPHGPVWAASATASSMLMGMAMAMYHYPNEMLETGGDGKLAALELVVTALQPGLFALGTTYWSVDASWWGNTTLGCYVIHFVFRDRMTELFQVLSRFLTWDSSGLLLPASILACCLGFTSTVGPLGHYVLILPQLAFGYLRRRQWTGKRTLYKK